MPLSGMLRKIDTNTFSALATVPTKIPTIKYGRDLVLWLSGTMLTAVTPDTLEDNPLSLLPAIDLVGASGDSGKSGSLHRISGLDLYVLNAFETSRFGYIQRTGTRNATPYPFGAMITIPFTTFPEDSFNLLPHPAFSNLELDVTWGAGVLSLTTDPAASFTTTPTLQIFEATREAAPPASVSMMKTVAKNQPVLIPSQTNDIDLKTGLPIQSFLCRVNDNSLRDDAFCTQLDLIENDTINHLAGVPWALMQAYNAYRGAGPGGRGMGYPFVEAADDNTSDDTGLGVTNRATMKGYVYVNLVDLEGAPVATSGMDSFKLRLTCTTSGGGVPNSTVILRQRVG